MSVGISNNVLVRSSRSRKRHVLTDIVADWVGLNARELPGCWYVAFSEPYVSFTKHVCLQLIRALSECYIVQKPMI